MKYTDRELLEVIASRLRSIVEDMQHLTTGNLAHNGCAIRGRLLRNAELIEKHLKQAQYIDKSALVAEIERKLKNINLNYVNAGSHPSDSDTNKKLQDRISKNLQSLLSFIDTLEVKEVDFEEKATQLSQIYFPNEENIWARPNIEAQKCKIACIEMVEWLEAQKGE